MVLFLLLPTPALSQSIDSLPGFSHVRAFTDQHKTPILVALGIGSIGAHGLANASFYSKGEVIDIHGAAEILGAFHFATSYAAGLDPVQAMGVAILGDVIFQCFINAAYDKPWYWQPGDYRAFGVPMPKNSLGPAVQIPLGVVMVLYKPVLRWVF